MRANDESAREVPAERKGPVERDLSDSRKGAGLAGTQSRGEPAKGEEGKAAQCERSPIVSTDKLSLSLLVGVELDTTLASAAMLSRGLASHRVKRDRRLD